MSVSSVSVATHDLELIGCCFSSFVGLGEDPQVLAIRAPQLFSVRPRSFFRVALSVLTFTPQMIASTYPDVINGVPRV